MDKIAVVYWSGTGNTQTMAGQVAEGARAAGADVTLLEAEAFDAAMLENFPKVAFGCPSMGAEELEETTFEPMFASLEGQLGGRVIALFGSYGWGDGEWMRSWKARCEADGAVLAAEPVIANEAPDEEAQAQCRALGAALAKA